MGSMFKYQGANSSVRKNTNYKEKSKNKSMSEVGMLANAYMQTG